VSAQPVEEPYAQVGFESLDVRLTCEVIADWT
jgi:hypothetical protein